MKLGKWQVAALVLVLSLMSSHHVLHPANGLPYEHVWLRIRSDPRLKSTFVWSEFAAAKGSSLDEALADRSLKSQQGHQLHLYRLEELDTTQRIEDLNLKQREKFYLTDEDLMAV